MMRITTSEHRRALTLRLEGRLEGPWVALLEKCWRKAANGRPGKAFRVDLSGVSFIDPAGQRLVADMHKEGVAFTADDALTRAMIDEITVARVSST